MTKRADIILVGGGSGGHLTPLIPIAEQLHNRNPSLRIAHIGQKKDPLNSIVSSSDISQHYEISAGKLRRFHGESWLQRVLNVRDNLLNVRDMFRVIAGTYQSWALLRRLKPKAILAKGGYVGVPVCFAARLLRIPYITHDSDAMISLANKLISGGAIYHATALDPINYKGYDREKIVQVGVPVRSEFKKVTADGMKKEKEKMGYSSDNKILLITGGGLGARRINDVAVDMATELLNSDKDLIIIHLTGHKLYDETKEAYKENVADSLLSRIKIVAFSDVLHSLSAASNVIVTRAGATNMAEFSVQAKACIVVPNPLLTGGHQSKNAKVYEDVNAAIVVQEEDIKNDLLSVVIDLLNSRSKQKAIGKALNSLFVPDAASKIADLLLEVADKNHG